ncbi:MAG: tail fiber domain-containing protein [Proteobacteria bacterium]|nr:tail fiber domain-containing protein [Pseudomonadota bacterium]
MLDSEEKAKLLENAFQHEFPYKRADGAEFKQPGATIHSSDKRLKKDIIDIPYGLAEIMVLKPKAYNWIDHGQEHKSFGLLAQDVQTVMQEIVNIGSDKDQTLGLNYIEFIPVLIKSIQEQQAIIDAQDQKINNLILRMETLIYK